MNPPTKNENINMFLTWRS